jgi:hypothetical protein
MRTPTHNPRKAPSLDDAAQVWLAPALPTAPNESAPRWSATNGTATIFATGQLGTAQLHATAGLLRTAAAAGNRRLVLAVHSAGSALVGLPELVAAIRELRADGVEVHAHVSQALGGMLLPVAACQSVSLERTARLGGLACNCDGQHATGLARYLPALRRGVCLKSILGPTAILGADAALAYGWADRLVDNFGDTLAALDNNFRNREEFNVNLQ